MDIGLLLANLAGSQIKGRSLYDAQRKAAAEAYAKEQEAESFIPGNVAMAALTGKSPDDPSLAVWAGAKLPVKYWGQVGNLGESIATTGRTRELLPYEKESEAAKARQYEASGRRYDAQAKDYTAQAEGREADNKNRLPISSLVARATGLDESDPSLSGLSGITIDPADADAFGSFLASFVKAQTGVATRPGEVAEAEGKGVKEYALAGKAVEEAETERALRDPRVQKVLAEVLAEQALAAERETAAGENVAQTETINATRQPTVDKIRAEAEGARALAGERASGGRGADRTKWTRDQAYGAALDSYKAYTDDYRKQFFDKWGNPKRDRQGKPIEIPEMMGQEEFIQEWYKKFAPEFANTPSGVTPPPERPGPAGGSIVDQVNAANPAEFVQNLVANAPSPSNPAAKGSLQGAINGWVSRKAQLLQMGANVQKVAQIETALRERMKQYNADYKRRNPKYKGNGPVTWPK